MSIPDAFMRFHNQLKARLQLPLNGNNKLLVRENGQWGARPTAMLLNIINSDTELATAQGSTESFSNVFNTWKRISRLDGSSTGNVTGDSYSDEAIPAELDGWAYDPATDSITSTINSASLIGFISTERSDDYTYEVVMKSTSDDNDFVGLCIAHATNQQTGKTEILTVMRYLNGVAPMVVEKNPLGFNVREYLVQGVFSGLKWADGTVTTEPGVTTLPGWSTIPNGVKLKITRSGDTITIQTSQLNEATYFAPATTVIDLAADPALAVFRGAQRYGYVCLSQPQSTWETLQRPGAKVPIFDLRTNTLWQFQDGVWVSTTSSLGDLRTRGLVADNWLVVSPSNNTFYYTTATSLRAF